jgi:UPF0755 protein
MKPKNEFITIKDWIAFFVTTFLIFLSSVLLLISGAIFYFLGLVKKKSLLVILSLFGLILLYVVIQWTAVPISWRAEGDSVTVIIKEGDSMSKIVERLKETKLINDGNGLLLLSKLSGKDRHIHAGRYDFKKGLTPYSLFKQLVRGDVTLKDVTIPEGSTLKQIAGILKRDIQIDSTEFVRVAENRQFAQSMGISAFSLEGYLFPETYKLSWGISSEKAAQMMVEQFKKTFSDSLLKRAQEINFSLLEVVILASLIEAEVKDGK